MSYLYLAFVPIHEHIIVLKNGSGSQRLNPSPTSESGEEWTQSPRSPYGGAPVRRYVKPTHESGNGGVGATFQLVSQGTHKVRENKLCILPEFYPFLPFIRSDSMYINLLNSTVPGNQ